VQPKKKKVEYTETEQNRGYQGHQGLGKGMGEIEIKECKVVLCRLNKLTDLTNSTRYIYNIMLYYRWEIY
jgi:hypothetical protein